MKLVLKVLAVASLSLFAMVLPAAAQAAHSVTLAWSASSSVGAGYNVYRATVTGGPYTLLNTAPLGTTTLTYVDTAGLVEGTKYFYVVRAVLSGVESVNSNEVSTVIPPSPPVLKTPVVT